MQKKVSFRHDPALPLAAVLMMLAMASLAVWAPNLLAFEVVPLAVAVWGARAGTDADADGLTVIAAFGRRHIPWPRVAGFATIGRGRVVAQLTTGGSINLPAVSTKDLRRLVAASGSELAAVTG